MSGSHCTPHRGATIRLKHKKTEEAQKAETVQCRIFHTFVFHRRWPKRWKIEENFVDVPERPTKVLERPIRVTREQPGNDPRSWADRVAGESHNEQPARSMYPSHLRSEVDSFDGVLPNTTLDELSSTCLLYTSPSPRDA